VWFDTTDVSGMEIRFFSRKYLGGAILDAQWIPGKSNSVCNKLLVKSDFLLARLLMLC